MTLIGFICYFFGVPPPRHGPQSLRTLRGQASKLSYLSWSGRFLLGSSSLLGDSHPSQIYPALPVISVPRAQCGGSRSEGWLPGQRRIKPWLCQAADWLRRVPPPAILRVGGRGKGLQWAGRGTGCPAQDRPPPPRQSPWA